MNLGNTTALTPIKNVRFTKYAMPVKEAIAVRQYLQFAATELTDEVTKMRKDKTAMPQELQEANATHALLTAWIGLQIELIDTAISKRCKAS